jgi:hypothetical protein
LEEFNITGIRNTGFIIGEISGGTNNLSNIIITNSSLHGVDSVGGLVGRNIGDLLIIESVFNYANISSSSDWIGAFVGVTANRLFMSQAINYGNINGVRYVGGLIGRAWNSPANSDHNLILDQVGNFGAVHGTESGIGGLIGGANDGNEITISNAFNLGEVSNGGTNIGGIIGFVQDIHLTLSAIYSAGIITSSGINPRVGLIFGRFGNTLESITQLFTETSILISRDDLNLFDGWIETGTPGHEYDSASTKFPIADMKEKDTYTNWDISTEGNKIWRIIENLTLPWLSFMGNTPPDPVINP